MKNFTFLILAILFVFSSCYIYKPYQFKEVETVSPSQKKGAVSLRPEMEKENNRERENESAVRKQRAEEESKQQQKSEMGLESPGLSEKDKQELEEKEAKNRENLALVKSKNPNENISIENNAQIPLNTSTVDSLKIKIKPNLYYRILADGNRYKIQADQWEGDTLVSHILRRPEKVLRFHKNQIDEPSLEERRFSKPFSDLITVGSYVAGGVAVLLLVL